MSPDLVSATRCRFIAQDLVYAVVSPTDRGLDVNSSVPRPGCRFMTNFGDASIDIIHGTGSRPRIDLAS